MFSSSFVRSGVRPLLLAATAGTVSSGILRSWTTTRCDDDDDDEKTKTTTVMTEEDNKVVAVRDYENLPEEDEETSCTICMINRQGPCRPHWRKVEYCLKDYAPSEKEDDSAKRSSLSSACDQYTMAFLECLQNHRNLYTLLTNDVYQKEYIDTIEATLMEVYDHTPEPWSDPDVDMSDVVSYIREKGYHQLPNVQSPSLSDLAHLARWGVTAATRTPAPIYDAATYAGDPELLEIRIRVELYDRGLPIDMAYAKDETGRVLGFEQFRSELEDATNNSSGSGVLRIHIRPMETRQVKLTKLYKSEEKNADGNDETVFYQSEAMDIFLPCLQTAVNEANEEA